LVFDYFIYILYLLVDFYIIYEVINNEMFWEDLGGNIGVSLWLGMFMDDGEKIGGNYEL
jgi:hypothetical protein